MTVSVPLSVEKMPSTWQRELAAAVRDPAVLADQLSLDVERMRALCDPQPDFVLRVPANYIRRMQPGNWQDPLLQEILPQARERELAPGYSVDPLQEKKYCPVPGVIHKYAGRVLVTLTGACAVHCRYCFRRHFPYQEHVPSRAHWPAILDYIRARADITEVILSGGDPMVLKDAALFAFIDQLATIKHVRRLRLHTRLPVVLPSRIDSAFLAALSRCSAALSWVMVLHVNHGQAIDAGVRRVCHQLRDAGVLLLNQSVMLAGVNDSVSVLVDLSERLFAAGVLPYYLHQLDAVLGAQHFFVSPSRAQTIVQQLRAQLPGYLCPRWVCETPGAMSKTVLG